jgi:hypothetical protein
MVSLHTQIKLVYSRAPLLCMSSVLCHRLLCSVRDFWVRIHNCLEQIVHNLGPSLASNLLDFVQLLLGILVGIVLGFLVARCVLRPGVSWVHSLSPKFNPDLSYLLLERFELLFLLCPVLLDLLLRF